MSRALALRRVAAFAAGFGRSRFSAIDAFSTGRFDLGNMTQAVWSTAHGDPLAVTNLAGEQTTRLASHFDPILVLFAPLWWVWPSPEAPAVAQAIAIALGALPVFWLGRKHLRWSAPRLGFALAYLLYPGTRLDDAQRVPPGRLREAAPALRVLVPRRGPLLPFAVWPRSRC